MATFISISGPSTTGKTSIIDSLTTYPELSRKAVFTPSAKEIVWTDLTSKGIFSEFTEISSDSDYLLTYIMKCIDTYNEIIRTYKDSDSLVILDESWVDLSIYALLQMWYTRIVKDVQEEILYKATKYDDISRIYLTKADDINYPVDKFRLRGKMSTFRMNRPLEIQYYNLAHHYRDAVPLTTSDASEAALFIVEDLRKLGHL